MSKKNIKKVRYLCPAKHKELLDAIEDEPRFSVEREACGTFLLLFRGRMAIPVYVSYHKLGYNGKTTKPRTTWVSKHASHFLREIESDLIRYAPPSKGKS